LLKFHEQKPSLDYLVEIQKHSALEEAEQPEPGPKERTMAVLKLTEWLGLTEAGIKVFVDNEWNEKGAAATGQGIVRMSA
jgi:hypothetical protein